MTGAPRKIPGDTDRDRMLDDPDRLVALAQASFAAAKDKAIAENDRLGVPSHGAVRGTLVVRHPEQARTLARPA